jgi:hypothetical protein
MAITFFLQEAATGSYSEPIEYGPSPPLQV